MKKLSNFLLLVAAVLVAVSCSNNATPQLTEDQITDTHRAASGSAAGALTETQTVTLNGQEIKIDVASVMTALANENAMEAAEDAANIMNSLMGADKEAQVLDVNFIMADEPVENGMFVFGIETETGKDLTMQMFDEEGFGMVANNEFAVTQGNNFKALNVTALNSGNYIFRLKDADGKELQRTVTVANK